MFPSAARRSLGSLIPPKIATPGAVVSPPSPISLVVAHAACNNPQPMHTHQILIIALP